MPLIRALLPGLCPGGGGGVCRILRPDVFGVTPPHFLADKFPGSPPESGQIPRDLDELSEYCSPAGADTVDRTRRFKWSGDDIVLNFGKNSGRTLKDLAANDPGFLRWIINNDFSDEVKEIAQNALMGKFPVRKGTAKNESGEG